MNTFITRQPCRKHLHARPACGWHRPVHGHLYGYDERDIVTRTYDATDRIKTETDAEGNATTYTYDPAGNVIAVLDAEGHTTRFEYDEMNRRTAVEDATGYRSESTLTQRGDVIGLTNANEETDSLTPARRAAGIVLFMATVTATTPSAASPRRAEMRPYRAFAE
jgi:YD repeat-containing protein